VTLILTCILQQQENVKFRKLSLFTSSGEGRETTTVLGPLERAELNHSRSKKVNHCSRLRKEMGQFLKTLFSTYSESRTKFRNQMILSVINPNSEKH
jgi:hypothetical protein